jgi:hypothetical protein
VETDEEGTFTLAQVPPGDYALRSAPRGRTLLADTGRRLVIPPGGEERVEFTIERGGDVEVRVVSGTGAVLAGVRVDWRSPVRDEAGFGEGPQGVVRLLDLPPGPVTLSASAPGHRPEQREVEVTKGGSTAVTIPLRKD